MIPFRQAKYYRWIDPNTPRIIRKIMLHTIEIAEVPSAAEATAAYFQNPRGPDGSIRQVSAHYCVDSDSVVQCVHDRDVAFACPGANHDGLHIEIAGRASQGVTDWADAYSLAALARVVDLVVAKCQEHSISAGWLTPADLAEGFSIGLCTHADGSEACKIANTGGMQWSPFYNAKNPKKPLTDHTDPGHDFPKAWLLEQVRARLPR